jgi:hypothetical protein
MEFLELAVSPEAVRLIAEEANDVPGAREDVDRVCEYLRKTMIEQGGPRRNITKKWRREARLLFDVDGYTEEQVRYLINWSWTPGCWWWGQIDKMEKLRQKAPTLVGRIKNERDQRKNGKSGGGRKSRQEITQETIDNFTEESYREFWERKSDPNGYHQRRREREARGEDLDRVETVDGETGEPVPAKTPRVVMTSVHLPV